MWEAKAPINTLPGVAKRGARQREWMSLVEVQVQRGTIQATGLLCSMWLSLAHRLASAQRSETQLTTELGFGL